MNILLAADGSDYTKRAARYLAEHLGTFAGQPAIHVLHVHPPLPYPGAVAAAGRAAVERYQREDSAKALAVAGKELRKRGVAFTASYVVGDIAASVKDAVKKKRIDLVVMGSHGHGTFTSLVLGSAATKILATVKVPILIVR